MKTRTFLTALLLMVTTSIFATTLSEYCETPSGHLGNAEFGDRNGRISLTITKTGDTELSVTVAPQDEDKFFDFISVTVSGGETYTLGENENGDTLTEHTLIIPFDIAPEEVTFSSIQWSNVSSGAAGNWVLYSITVPFDITCNTDAVTDGSGSTEDEDTTTDSSVSQYCDYPTAHFDNEANGGLASLTITNTGSNTIAITMAPRADSDVIIDYLYVVVNGVGYSVGEDEGDILDEYTIEITFDEAPEEVTFSEIMWSNPDWGGRWMLQNITVPFNASCDGSGSTEENEDVTDDKETTTTLSEYCETPSGHLGNVDFGDTNGRMLLTITKVSDTELSVTVAPRVDSGCVFDYLSVSVSGGSTYTCGENEGDLFDEYTVIIPFDPVPEEVTFSSIQWSHSGFAGNWVVYSITVPFNAACDVDLNDEVAPVVTTATVAATTSTSITLNVAATDADNDGNDTGAITKFILNDTTNGITDYAATVEEDGTITLTDLNPLTTYNLTITAQDAAGNVSEGVTVTVATDDYSKVSEYCERSIGHFGTESGSSVIRLTITNVDETSFKVTVQPGIDTGNVLDQVSISVSGFSGVTLGSNLDSETGYDSLLGEDEFTYTFTYASVDEVPALISFNSIMWSYTDWSGNNMLSSFTVPFAASCEVVELDDAVAPVMVSASVESVSITSATLYLEATDTDDAGDVTTVSSFIFNDTTNGIYNLTVKTDASGIATLTGLTAGTTYNFTVVAKDENSNISENSLELSFTTEEAATSLLLDDFEDGNCDGWGAQEGSNALSVVANPYVSGINTSSYVLCGGRSVGTNNWAAAMLSGLNIDGGLYGYLHVMMYRDVLVGEPNAKMSDSIGGDIYPASGQTMVTSEWQDVVYDISTIFVAGTTMDFLYYMYDRGELTEDAIVYLDNIELNNDPDPRTVGMADAIKESSTATTSVYGVNGTIYVKSATPATVTIYTLTGSTVATSKAVESGVYTLPSGCYIVRVGAEVYKVVI